MTVRMNEGAGSCNTSHVYFCFQVGHFHLEDPTVHNGTVGLKSLKEAGGRGSRDGVVPGGVRTCVSALILTHYWETHMDVRHEGHLSNCEQGKSDGPNNINQVKWKREIDRSALSFDLVAKHRFL